MESRGITRDEVMEALQSPDTTYLSKDYPEDRLVVRGKTSSGRRLKIVTDAGNNEIIITVAGLDEEG